MGETVAERVAIVWNPSKAEREELERELNNAREKVSSSAEIEWFETTEEDPGQGAASRGLEWGAEVLVAVGGDGTVRAVAEHLADSGAHASLAIVPLGTGNLLARNLDVPLGDQSAAFARALSSEAERVIDAGWAEFSTDEGRVRQAFFVMAGFGIDAHMITETDDDLKQKAGWLAYVESLGRAVSASEIVDVRLTLDGGSPEPARAHTVIIGNCGTLQGGVALLPDADPSDGELDLLLLSAEGVAGWLDTMRSMLWDNGLRRIINGGDATSSDSVSHGRARTILVEMDDPRVVEIDGEDIGETDRLEIAVHAGAVRVR